MMKSESEEDKRHKAYQYRFYPSDEQAVLIQKTFGCVRFVYNRMLADRKDAYERLKEDKEALRKQKHPQPADYKKEYTWLKEVDSLALANAQLDLQAAYRNFFRDPSVGFPRFKSKHRDRKSYTTNNQKGTIRFIDNHTLRLPILKDIQINMHRPIPSDAVIKSATIRQTATDAYTISILTEYERNIQPVKPSPETVLGLDYASASLYVDSEGQSANYPRFYRKAEARLKKATRRLSRRKKGGKNREKQRQKVAKLYQKTANQRKDFLHKRSRQIANAYSAVAIEDLNMKHLARGLNLAKSTNDNGFGQFRGMLAYKLAEQGKQLVIIDRWYPSSKLCSGCGYIHKTLTLADRTWICPECKITHDRDVNAAINIKHEGCRLLGAV